MASAARTGALTLVSERSCVLIMNRPPVLPSNPADCYLFNDCKLFLGNVE